MDESDNDGGVRDNCLSLPALELGSAEHPRFCSLSVCVKRYHVHRISNITVIPVIHVFCYLMSVCVPPFIIGAYDLCYCLRLVLCTDHLVCAVNGGR